LDKRIFAVIWFCIAGVKVDAQRTAKFLIQLLAAVFASLAAFYFPLTNVERALVFICIGMVLAAEIFNTSLEKLTDLVSPEYNKKAAEVKDLAAAAVLVLSLVSLIVAVILFLPYFRSL